jgi:hypothetical protein
MTGAVAAQRRATLAVAAGLTGATLAAAAPVRLWWAADVRRALAFPFAGVPANLDAAAAIFANNARLLAAVFAAVLVAQSPWLIGRNARRDPAASALLAAVDAVLVLSVAANTTLLGAAVGAYGTRMIAAVLPHGPLELLAFAVALALHLRAHRGPLPASDILATATACLAMLALAAVLETYAAL